MHHGMSPTQLLTKILLCHYRKGLSIVKHKRRQNVDHNSYVTNEVYNQPPIILLEDWKDNGLWILLIKSWWTVNAWIPDQDSFLHHAY